MGFFKRSTTGGRPFWQVSPLPGAAPEVLHQHGISCYARSDGPGAIAAGWALWDMSGLDAHQAWDLLTDGFHLWEASAGYDRAEAKRFLHGIIDRLQGDPVVPWPDLHAVPPAQVQPLATHYSARCWAASELRELLDDDERPAIEDVLFDVIRRARFEFVPPRSMAWAREYAQAHGHPEPWT